MSKLTTDELMKLEGFIDKAGLPEVVENIAQICGLKAEHIRANWQDNFLARTWDKAGNQLSKVAEKLPGNL